MIPFSRVASRWTLTLFGVCSFFVGRPQPPTSQTPAWEYTLPALDQFQELEGDYPSWWDALLELQRHPINLNQSDLSLLTELPILTTSQLFRLQQHIRATGPLLSLYELQAIPGFDSLSIQRLLPYVTLDRDASSTTPALGSMLRNSRHQVLLRWSRYLEPGANTPGNPLAGNPDQVLVRWQGSYYQKLSWGLTAEKDRGEAFFRGSNPQGFDYYSAHLQWQHLSRRIPLLLLGDFTASFGQGVLLGAGSRVGKSGQVMQVKRPTRIFRPHRSATEGGYLRGAALTWTWNATWHLHVFYSQLREDARLVDDSEGQRAASSLLLDGFHRTPLEIARKGVLPRQTMGLRVSHTVRQGQVGVQALTERLRWPLDPTPALYNQFYFRGQRLTGFSIDYSWQWRQIHAFGESAWSDNGAGAHLAGALLTLHPQMDLSMVFRHYSPKYQALRADPFEEGSQARNETGLYLALVGRWGRSWEWQGYLDVYHHPWLRYQVQAPTRGWESRFRLTTQRRHHYLTYLEWRVKTEEMTQIPPGKYQPIIILTQRQQLRWHLEYHWSKHWEWRCRFDWGQYQEGNSRQAGYSLVQDLLYQPMVGPFSGAIRIAYTHSPGYNVRFYHYESQVLQAFSILPYYHRGWRWYTRVRYRPAAAFTIEGRVAQTLWLNQSEIGSGPDAIPGGRRTQLTLQLLYQWGGDAGKK